MKQFEIILFWITIFSYVIIFAFQLFAFVRQKEKSGTTVIFLLWGVFVLHTALGIIHWSVSGHPPVTDTFELNLTGTWFTMLLFLGFEKSGRIEKPVALVVVPVTFLVLGYGYLKGIKFDPMGPAFQSPWLAVHVIFAWLAFGCYAIATGTSIFFLLKKRKPESGRLKKLPPPEELDINSYRYVILGFINHAVMIVSGALWAKKLWGHYWMWDPLETWSLIAFLFYAFYLHARSFLKWKMEKAAYLTIAGLLILIISYWGVEFFGPTMHPGP